MTMIKSMQRALDALRKPGARLVLLHTHKTTTGNAFYISPDGGRISDEVARCSNVTTYSRSIPVSCPASRRAGGSATGADRHASELT
jgi:hypothetical protein